MSRYRSRDDDSISTGTILGVLIGVAAGVAAGMYLAQRAGGISGLTSKLRRKREAIEDRLRGAYGEHEEEELDEYEEDELELEDYDEILEERVLEAFRNDPILAERAVDIGSIGDGVIELAGWVEDEEESKHAVTLARGVPGVDTVVNRIAIGDEERRFEDAARKVRRGDPSLTEAQWEGRSVGIGRRRQGTSDEPDRHASAKVPLETRWQNEEDAIRNAAGEIEGTADRRVRASRSAARGDRAGGSPVAPSGVPKADHVAKPLDASARTEPPAS